MSASGVIIELDYTALNGAEILFETTKKFLKDLDKISLTEAMEARFLAGKKYQDGLAALFSAVKTKKTAQKASRNIAEMIDSAMATAVGKPVSKAFLNFVREIVDAGHTVILMTSVNADVATAAFEPILSDCVRLYHNPSPLYAASAMDAWLRTCKMCGLDRLSTVVITGTGFGVRSALLSGVRSIGVINPHVEYQDFGGANFILNELSSKTAKKVIEFLGV